MQLKRATDVTVGDTVFLKDGRPVVVTGVGRGMVHSTVLIDFAQPQTGDRVDLPFYCVNRDAEVEVALSA